MIVKNFIDWGSCFFGIDNNTFATLLITLSILILSKIIDFIYSFIKLLFEIRNTKKTTIRALKSLIKSIEQQGKYFYDFQLLLTFKNEEKPFNLSYVSMPHTQIIKDIGYRKILNSFLFWKIRSEKMIKRIERIIAVVNVVQSIEKTCK